MATQEEISSTYDWIDEIFREGIGEHGDYTCAFYDGDYSKTLEQAQQDKHDYILRGINFKKGQRVLDVGCGWGPMLKAVKDGGGAGVGLTLSEAQAAWDNKKGLEVYLQDYKTADLKELGQFDAVVSVGAFEHFCSVQEFEEGTQEEVYRQFFKFCASVLPSGGKLYLQTMTWGKSVPNPKLLIGGHPKGSDEFHVSLALCFYPGSWLPSGLDQVRRCAEPYFNFISTNNGRLDYIQTLKEWGRRMGSVSSWRVAIARAKLLPKYLLDKNFRQQLKFIFHSSQTEIFKRSIFSHERIIFEKK